MPQLELFPFRFRDPVSGKWIRARYVAQRDDIAERYAEWEIIGPPEIRDADSSVGYFNPWPAPRPDETPVKEPPGNKPPPEREPPSKKPPVKEPKQIGAAIEQGPQLDDLERFLVHLFLRRYVTYCARRAAFAQMNGAAQLLMQEF
jgi:hypothetical protein